MKKQVYISSCVPEGGIYTYEITQDKSLKQAAFLPLDRPMYTIAKNNRLYVLLRDPLRNGNSAFLSYEICTDGALENPTPLQSTLGTVGCHLCVDAENVYVTNYVSGSVFKAPDVVITHEGRGPHPTRQEKAHTHFVTVTPDNRYLLVTDLGMDKIFVYDKHLKAVNSVDAPSGAGPRHLAFSEDGKLCYCADELSSAVSVYRYENGSLTYLSSHSALPADFKDQNTTAAIRYKNGYLYVSNRGHNSIVCFKAVGENLELQSITDCGGVGPRDFILTDDLLICTNENDGSVVLFEIENNTKLIKKQTVKVPAVLCATVVEVE